VSSADVASRHARAWLTLVVILALHVTDEALTDFLFVYNPIVLQLRALWSWFPMPTFTFGPWLGGLIVLVIVLGCSRQAFAPADQSRRSARSPSGF